MDGPGFVKSKLDGTELCDWFDAGVDELLDAFRANDHDHACPTRPFMANRVDPYASASLWLCCLGRNRSIQPPAIASMVAVLSS